MNINGTMLNLEDEIGDIIEHDPWTSKEVNSRWVLNHSKHEPEWYESLAFNHHWKDSNGKYEEKPLDCIEWKWKIYADALREFGVVLFTNDQVTGVLHTDKTRSTVKTLIEQYGFRNVTNEFAKQIASKLNIF